MSKSTATYWNPLIPDRQDQWQTIENTGGLVEQLTLASDEKNGDYTRLTRFKPGADTCKLGTSCHDYPEEIFIVSGRLYDAAFDLWLETGHYASRPPGERHGPFKTDEGCLVLEISYPSQALLVEG
ncbi:MAG: cupin domain-containing protein [Methylomonas sp.]|nr:cupin domain-containing protein [Methylomonas sp.]